MRFSRTPMARTDRLSGIEVASEQSLNFLHASLSDHAAETLVAPPI